MTDTGREGEGVELKACPFCGGEALRDKTLHTCPAEHWIKCGQCENSTTAYASRESATRAWNTRAPQGEG